MAGTFAHIALVDLLCQDGDALDGIATLTPAMKRALMQFNNFCELGAISPAAPLALMNMPLPAPGTAAGAPPEPPAFGARTSFGEKLCH